MLSVEGYRYEGRWVNDRQEGLGVESWLTNNSRFVGNFREGKKNGHGHYYWDDGSYYVGNFLDGQFDGSG